MGLKLRKIGIIGMGHVGSNVAFALAARGLADELYLMDEIFARAEAQAMDINDAVSYLPHEVRACACEIKDCGDCDLLYIAAGPIGDVAEDRLDSLAQTVAIVKDIAPQIKASGFKGIIVSITNPADVIAAYLQQQLDYPAQRILSTGTALDSARLQRIVGDILQVSHKTVQAYVLGEHGNSAMVPWSLANIAGKSLTEIQQADPQRFLDFDRAEAAEDMKKAGYRILLGKGSTEYGIASTAAELACIILHDEKKCLPCSVYLEGQYGEEGIFASLPAVIGKDGVEAVLEVKLTEEEKALFVKSCAVIRHHLNLAQKM